MGGWVWVWVRVWPQPEPRLNPAVTTGTVTEDAVTSPNNLTEKSKGTAAILAQPARRPRPYPLMRVPHTIAVDVVVPDYAPSALGDADPALLGAVDLVVLDHWVGLGCGSGLRVRGRATERVWDWHPSPRTPSLGDP